MRRDPSDEQGDRVGWAMTTAVLSFIVGGVAALILWQAGNNGLARDVFAVGTVVSVSLLLYDLIASTVRSWNAPLALQGNAQEEKETAGKAVSGALVVLTFALVGRGPGMLRPLPLPVGVRMGVGVIIMILAIPLLILGIGSVLDRGSADAAYPIYWAGGAIGAIMFYTGLRMFLPSLASVVSSRRRQRLAA